MANLLFFTDRYPYNNSEAFIENEIAIMASYFERVYCIPCGLMVDTKILRQVPSNVCVIQPPCSDNIFNHRPGRFEKILWALKNLIPWFILCLVEPKFYTELYYLITSIGFSAKRFIRIFRVLAPSLRNVYYYKKILSEYKIDDVYCYSYWIDPTILFTKKILPSSRIVKKVSRTHRVDLYSEAFDINYIPFQKQVIKEIDRLFIISDDGFGYLSLKYPEFSNKYCISRLGTLDKGLNPEKSDGMIRVVSCSHIHNIKRVDLIVETISELSKHFNNVEWIHFGTGQLFADVKKLAEDKLESCSYKLMGGVSNRKIIEYYQSTHIDLFINLSSSEGIPVSIMEAASFGIPIVATDVGGTKEIVYGNKNGLLIKVDEKVEIIVESICKFLTNRKILLQARLESRKIWENLYYSNKNYVDFYRILLNL